MGREIFEQQGIWLGHLELPDFVHSLVKSEDYQAIDRWAHSSLAVGGQLRNFLYEFGEFTHTEHILALRRSPEDEDGIWHDDSSRLFAFSWALTQDAQSVEGGELLFRPFGADKALSVPALQAGGLIVFKTGQFGYEHKVNQVIKGERLVFTGWLS